MKHPIDPTVDYVFKLLFGAEENRDLLLDLLNSLLRLPQPIADVQILNPYTGGDFEDDGHTVVDVKARDQHGRIFQVEIQVRVRTSLKQRMVYTWADVYQGQLQTGDKHELLRPVISIWILKENLLRDTTAWHHHFRLCDPDHGVELSDHLAIHTVELKKWHLTPSPLDTADQWVYFLKEAGRWNRLPDSLDTPLLRKAMAILDRVSEREADYWRYQGRMNFLREQASIEDERRETFAAMEELRAAKEEERAAKEQERAAKEQAQAQVAALQARLRALGIDLDV